MMKIDHLMTWDRLGDIPEVARRAEELGFDAVLSSETKFDPFFRIVLAAEHTRRIQLGTCVAVAFARNPMTLASTAWELHDYSGGRFLLGLGANFPPQVTKRFSMPADRPVARLRELVLAMREIWRAWETGERLSFRGDFYSHTFMAPLFDPGPNPHGTPPVLMAAVGPKMLEAAGEVADGVLLHPITTRKFLDEVTLPALARGWSTGGRTRSGFAITCPRFVATGTNGDELARAVASTRELVGLYGATPNYRAIFELHGWEAVHDELRSLQRSGKGPADLAEAVPDEVLHTIATVGEPEEVGRALARDFAGILDRTACFHNYDSTLDLWARVAEAMRSEAASVGTTTPT